MGERVFGQSIKDVSKSINVYINKELTLDFKLDININYLFAENSFITIEGNKVGEWGCRFSMKIKKSN